MTDREKVIKGLETCFDACHGATVCLDCAYSHDYGGGCEAHLLQDALALLKAQQPRVMTLEEILDRGDDEPPFLEYNLSTISVLRPDIFQPDNSDEGGTGYMRVVSACCASGFYNRKEYGKTWRCWTSKPTDEQMEATPWNT